MDEVQLVRYAGASGDFNPLHYVESLAQKAGFNKLIAQGMLVMGFVGQAVSGWIPNKFLRRLRVRFVNVTYLGDTISVVGKIIEMREEGQEVVVTSEVKAIDQNGEEKITGLFEAVLLK
ncbi:MAG: hypothetical protein JL57_11995 [Desulfosporosinus sp. BICA1-9]|nr:MAG: hypothetical protein JL57_11995 [Desulfosporosinus sp. BICA1-9]